MGTNEIEETVARMAPRGLMNTAQAAEFLGIKPTTLCVWRSTNRCKLPYVKVGGQVRYRRQDLDDFISANLRNVSPAE